MNRRAFMGSLIGVALAPKIIPAVVDLFKRMEARTWAWYRARAVRQHRLQLERRMLYGVDVGKTGDYSVMSSFDVVDTDFGKLYVHKASHVFPNPEATEITQLFRD